MVTLADHVDSFPSHCRNSMKISNLLAVVVLITLSGSTSTRALADPTTTLMPSPRQWDVHELTFTSDEPLSKPYGIDFSIEFTSPGGQSLEVPGFFNGGSQFVVRFTPPCSGEWNYVTRSALASLDNQQGTLRVEPPETNQRGGIVVDEANQRNFRYQNGENYYPIAFECDWLFALDAENPDDIPVTRKFVDTLAANGFNQVVMNVFAYDVNWKKDSSLTEVHEYGSPRVFPFGGDNKSPDYSTLDVEYFKRLDRVIEYLDQKGVAAHLMIYVWNKRVNWPDAESEADNRYFDYVVRRYQAYPNLIWDISKEALGYGHNDVNYITGRIKRLRKLDAYNRLVTVHDYGYCRRFPKQVDFISVQLWQAELYSVMSKVRSEFPGQPVLNIEHGGYERSPYVVFPGSYDSPEVCLERAYQCVFAGTYPTHYWQGAAWNVIIPDIDSLAPEDQPRLNYYQHMSTLVERYDLANLKAGDRNSNSGFCLHNNDDLFIYYVPKECNNIGVRLPKSSQGQMMTGTWFDPFTGEFGEPIEKKITQWPNFSKPEGNRFAILIVSVQPSSPHSPDLKVSLGKVSRSAVFDNETYSHWGGSVVLGDDGRYHMYYSRWPKQLGWAWVTDSEIAHAVADSPFGPYEFQDVVLPRRDREHWDGWCTHNPTVQRFGDKYYLYYMGNTGDGVVTTSPGKQKINWNHRNNQRIGVAVADSPNGPWTRSDQPLIDVSDDDQAMDSLMTSNPSICQRPDGGYVLIYKGVGKKFPLPGGGPVVHCVATSDSPTGPFTKHSQPVFTFEGERFPAEDPYIWYQDGKYRAIVKRMKHVNKQRLFSLVQFDSTDGYDWQPSKHYRVNERIVEWEDGETQKFDHLERPQVLLEGGKPIALLCAADTIDEHNVRHSYNIQIPMTATEAK